MKLYEINDRIEQILAAGTDLETGEITEEAITALDELEEQRNEKVLSVARYIKGEKAEGKAIIEAAQTMIDRGKKHLRRAERLEQYLAMQTHPGERFEDAFSEVKWMKSYRIEIDEGTTLPDEFIRLKIIEEPDKKALREAIKEGEEIDGVSLQPKHNLMVK